VYAVHRRGIAGGREPVSSEIVPHEATIFGEHDLIQILKAAALGTGIALLASWAAAAAPGVATGTVNLRAGPGTNYARIAVIPAGAPVEVLRCPRWCEVIHAGRRGWASASYIARGPGTRAHPVRAYPAYRTSPCDGAAAFETPFCEWPLERSIREFTQGSRDFQHRRNRR
jgi:uncharacterized protein YraI